MRGEPGVGDLASMDLLAVFGAATEVQPVALPGVLDQLDGPANGGNECPVEGRMAEEG
jgi:hypothetical protein